MDPLETLSFSLELNRTENLVRTITAQIKAAIVEGKMNNRQRMPSTRKLAAALKVSRNTIISVYEQLSAESLIYSEKGMGNFVSYDPQDRTPNGSNEANRLINTLLPHYRSKRVEDILPKKKNALFNFAVGYPETQYFPFTVWKRALNKSFNAMSRDLLPAPSPQGLEELRLALSHHLTIYRSIKCEADDLVVTTGTQQSLNIIANLLVERGKSKVAVEAPGYPMAYHVFKSAGAELCHIPVDEKGIVVEAIPTDVSVIYVTPSHQFPLGILMSAERRQALLAFAAANDIVIIEDDYDSELRFSGQPIDALKTSDAYDVVFYLTSLSKIMFPDIKTGITIPPRWAKEAFLAAKMQSDWSNPLYIQQALATFIRDGALYKYQRKMKRFYKKRFDCLTSEVLDYPESVKRVFPSHAGVHLCVELHEHLNAHAIACDAIEKGIFISSVAHFEPAKSDFNSLVFGFGRIETQQIPDGIAKLFVL